MKKTLTAMLAGFIAAAGLYAQTASVHEGYWNVPINAALDSALQQMQAGTAAEGPQSTFSVGLNFTFLSSFRGIGSITESETVDEVRRTSEHRLTHFDILGIGAFFDTGYAELSVRLSFGLDSWSGGTTGGWAGSRDGIPSESIFFALDFSVLFRLPLELPLGLPLEGYVFPLLGLGYNIVLSKNYQNPSHFNTVRIPVGAGLDVPIGNNTFLRTSVLTHYTFAPRFFRDRAAAAAHNASHSGRWGFSLVMGFGFGL